MSETTTVEPAVGGDLVSDQTPQAEKLLVPSGGAALYTFATAVTVPYNGATLHFRPGDGYELDPALLAWLQAGGINPTAV